jgi:hypothetical protein
LAHDVGIYLLGVGPPGVFFSVHPGDEAPPTAGAAESKPRKPFQQSGFADHLLTY